MLACSCGWPASDAVSVSVCACCVVFVLLPPCAPALAGCSALDVLVGLLLVHLGGVLVSQGRVAEEAEARRLKRGLAVGSRVAHYETSILGATNKDTFSPPPIWIAVLAHVAMAGKQQQHNSAQFLLR